MNLILIIFMSPTVSKEVAFQDVICVKRHQWDLFIFLYFVLSLWNPVCILYLQDILIWVHHVSTAQKPHEANGYQIRQCSLKAWKSKFLSTLCKVPHAFLASSSTTLPHIPFTLYSTLVTLLVYTCTCPWLLPLEIFLIRVLFPLPSAPFAKPAPQP